MIHILLASIPFITGLSSPDGLCSTGNDIYLSEETSGRILQIYMDGSTAVIAEGLRSPEGIYATDGGGILVVEDTESGRLIEIEDGVSITLATELCFPEGVTVDNQGVIWFTTGGIEGGSFFTTLWKLSENIPVIVYLLPSVFSFSDLEASGDGKIYICSESSGIVGNVSVFRFDPLSGEMIPFVTGIPFCEGIGMTDGGFPFYVTQESGALYSVDSTGSHSLLTDTLHSIEDVVVVNNQIYVSEDGTGSLLRLNLNE